MWTAKKPTKPEACISKTNGLMCEGFLFILFDAFILFILCMYIIQSGIIINRDILKKKYFLYDYMTIFEITSRGVFLSNSLNEFRPFC